MEDKFRIVAEAVNTSLIRAGVTARDWSRTHGVKYWRLSRLMNGKLPYRAETDVYLRACVLKLVSEYSPSQLREVRGVLENPAAYPENYDWIMEKR